jgi:anti-anti-sigma factor
VSSGSASGRGTLAVEQAGAVSVVSLLGEHDMHGAEELAATVATLADAGRGVVVSLADTDFVDSAIVRVLYQGDRRLLGEGRRLVLHVAGHPAVERVLELSGLLDQLLWSSALDEAVLFADPGRSGEPGR